MDVKTKNAHRSHDTRRYTLIAETLLPSACGIMPGMDNINTLPMRKAIKVERYNIKPTLIPITPTLIADQHIRQYAYRVMPSDVLNIGVWDHPEFTLESVLSSSNAPGVQGAAGMAGYLVNEHGNIYFPLIGYVHVSQKTVDTIRADITKRLDKYVPNPQVRVRVADFRGRKIYVLGEVNKSGFLPIADQRLTLADALSLSGWMNNDSADPRYIYIIRGDFRAPQIYWLDARTPVNLLLAEQFSMQPKDILYVSTAPATRWNRVLNQLLPTIQTIWYTQAVVKNS